MGYNNNPNLYTRNRTLKYNKAHLFTIPQRKRYYQQVGQLCPACFDILAVIE